MKKHVLKFKSGPLKRKESEYQNYWNKQNCSLQSHTLADLQLKWLTCISFPTGDQEEEASPVVPVHPHRAEPEPQESTSNTDMDLHRAEGVPQVTHSDSWVKHDDSEAVSLPDKG